MISKTKRTERRFSAAYFIHRAAKQNEYYYINNKTQKYALRKSDVHLIFFFSVDRRISSSKEMGRLEKVNFMRNNREWGEVLGPVEVNQLLTINKSFSFRT